MKDNRRLSENSASSLEELNYESERSNDSKKRQQLPLYFERRLVKLLMPNSKFRLWWDAFIFLSIWYNSVTTPIRLFILNSDTTPSSLIFMDIALDLTFVIDAVLLFYRPFIDKDTGRIVTNLHQIRSKCLSSREFYFNVIACVPIVKVPLAPLLDEATNLVLSRNSNILRMIRMLHFSSQFEDLKMFLSRKGPVNDSVFRMGIILFFTQLLMCILGCVYFGTAAASVDDICPDPDNFENEVLGADAWIATDSVITNVMDQNTCGNNADEYSCDDCPQQLFFVRSVYFLMQTLFTIGYGDSVVPSKSNVELILVCLFMLFGVFGFGLIIANMTSVLSNIDVVSMRFRHEMDDINKWMALRCVPETLRERIEMYFSYLVRTQHGMLDSYLFADLPPQLAKEFNHAIAYDSLVKIPFFNPRYHSTDLIMRVLEAMTRRIYPPGSIILHEGEKQREMIIIKVGRANLFVRGLHEPVGTIVPGDYVGDYQLLFGTVNQIGVSASTEFVEVLALTFLQFDCVMHEDIEFRRNGGNYRHSNDPGALETVENAKKLLTKVATNMKSLSNQVKSKKLMNMLQVNEVKTTGVCIMPSSKVHVYWDIFALFAIMYYSIASPLRFALYFRNGALQTSYGYSFYVDYIIDILFIFDFVSRLRYYAYIDIDSGRNEIITDKALIRKKYLQSSWFKTDRVAIVPLDILSSIFGHHTLMRLPKIFRVLQIPSVVKRLQNNFDACMGVSMTESQSTGLIMLIFSILIVVWSSAGWNAIRTDERMYESVYWALTTLTTVGYGDFTPNDFRETCYAIVIGAIGATFTAGIIANVTSFFHDVDISNDNTDHKLNCIKCFMENHACTLEQMKRIQEYFDYTEREQDGLNEELLLNKSVPDHLRRTLLVHLTQSMVIHCNIFHNCESGFLRQIMVSLEQRLFTSRNIILSSSMPSDGMYFIKKGIVELITDTGNGEHKTLKRLEADDNFAEGCLFEHWQKNPYTAVTVTDSELWFLSRTIFIKLVDQFPRVRAHMGTIIREQEVGQRRKSVHYVVTKAVERAKRKATRFIHPDGIFIQCWFGLVLITTLYNFFALPFRVAFMENHEIDTFWFAIDYVGDTILFFDIIIRALFLAYYDDNHLIITKNEILSHYLRSGKMKWHLLAFFPLEFIAISGATVMCPLWKLQMWSLLRINKLFRILEMGYLIHSVETSIAKAGVRVPKNAIRVGKLLMVILLSAHIVSCLFYMIAFFNQQNLPEPRANWAQEKGLMDTHQLSCPGDPVAKTVMIDRYVTALYWAMATLTTVGYGDITAHKDSIFEISFATIILVIGTAIYTMVIALLEDIVSQLDVTSSLHKMKMDKLNEYILSTGLPENIKSKIEAYYEILWKTQRGVRGRQLLHFFPSTIRTEVSFDLLSAFLQKTFFIKDCSTDFIANILNHISVEVYLPDDIVFNEGERCNTLNILYRGEIDLLTAKNVKFKTVSSCTLGEASFFGLEPHICRAKAANQCEIFVLEYKDFIYCLRDNHLMQKYVNYVMQNESQLEASKESIAKMIKNLKSSKMEKMLVDKTENLIPKGIILPGAISRDIWDTVAFLLTVAYTFIIPYQISFVQQSISISRFCVDCAIDAFFVLDVYARIKKFAVMKDGNLLTDPKEFRQLYIHGDFLGDLISMIPSSAIYYIIGIKDERYRMMRLFQLTRVRRFGTYLDNFIETCNTRVHLAISTAVMRILQIFFIVLFLCHWVACGYHFIGASSASTHSWIVADNSVHETMMTRYVRSFYWSLYTGYGSIPVITNWERIFAMFVMVAGAVICDAGITAILTSIISIRDQQAGTNNRRIQCWKRFMKTYMISDDLQKRVLNFYNYMDVELANIDEIEILDNLSDILTNEVLSFFCYQSLRESTIMNNISDGIVKSLVQIMIPYLAIPDEILTRQTEPCDSIYLLRSGMMNVRDSSGHDATLPLGSLIGHTVTAAQAGKYGLASNVLHLSIISAQGLKGRIGNPYVIFKVGEFSCCSSVKKTKDWKEDVYLKLPTNIEMTLQVMVKSWQKGRAHSIVGSTKISFEKLDHDNIKNLVMKDNQERTVGTLKLRIQYRGLSKSEEITNHELTTTAKGYCHLYCVKTSRFEELKDYFTASQSFGLEERLRGPITRYRQQADSFGIEGEKANGWTNLSSPAKCNSKPTTKNKVQTNSKRSLLIDRKIQRNTIQDIAINQTRRVSGTDGKKNFFKKTASFLSNRDFGKKSSVVHPEEHEIEEGRRDSSNEERSSWVGSNKIKSGTLSCRERNESGTISSDTEMSQVFEELSEKDESWDILVDLNDGSDFKLKQAKSKRIRRATFITEWETEK